MASCHILLTRRTPLSDMVHVTPSVVVGMPPWRKQMRRLTVMVMISMLLSGCMSMDSFLGSLSFGRASAAERAKSALIGRTRGQILSCAGVPDRTITEGDTEYFTYTRDGGTRTVDVYGTKVTKQRNCQVTIEFREGVVFRVIYSGSTGGLLTKGEQCGYIVSNCLY